MSKFIKLFLMTFLVMSCSQESEVKPKPTTPLSIITSAGEAKFNVEVAMTNKDLEVGLMHRKTLATNSGMIFNIYPVRPTAMWMKNTLVPLDIIFVDADGTISMIFENAVPNSEELLISREPVRAVIELNAGQVEKNKIVIGDKVTHSILNNMVNLSPENNMRQVQENVDVIIPELKKSNIITPPTTADVALAEETIAETLEVVEEQTAPVALPKALPVSGLPQPLPVPAP